MNQVYTYKKRIELYHLDGAKIIFYGQLFYFIHDAFAGFLRDFGFGIKDRLEKRDFVFPVVHAEADYKGLIFLDDEVDIELTVGEVGESSFTMCYKLLVAQNEVAQAKVVHATIGGSKLEKKVIPSNFRELLKKYSNNSI
ncbi:MAG: 1,4-dihydroxy-2-naphthoyl-CoA hydrolase [Chlamydiae bacterium]|nr:1,4-dihydroxy-2-naphthoyl-CoA hydrolase [Chlamydiota bacterium]